MLFSKPKPRWVKIQDPVAHAEAHSALRSPESTVRDTWGAPEACYTTTTHFGNIGGVRYYNNCGPTAVTNLICMYRQKYRGRKVDRETAGEIYDRVAKFGTSRLYFINSPSKVIHGTSDLRAGAYIRRCFSMIEGFVPKVRLFPLTEKNALRSLDQGALLYLMLLGHPEYGSHHLIGCGYTVLKDPATGDTKTYIKLCDGHNAAPRYLDTGDFRRRPGAFYEVQFPKERSK